MISDHSFFLTQNGFLTQNRVRDICLILCELSLHGMTSALALLKLTL